MSHIDHQEVLMKNYHEQVRTILSGTNYLNELGQLNMELEGKFHDLIDAARVDGLTEENLYLLLAMEKKGLEFFYTSKVEIKVA